MLNRDDKALLTDFGISYTLERRTHGAAVRHTGIHESRPDTGQRVDARSDIYSLGVMLFEMTTGRRPFSGDEPGLTEINAAQRSEAHLRVPPPDPVRSTVVYLRKPQQ